MVTLGCFVFDFGENIFVSAPLFMHKKVKPTISNHYFERQHISENNGAHTPHS